MEGRYGKADRVWVMDRGMVSEENVKFLAEGGRRYVVGTPRSLLKRYEKELPAKDWSVVREGLEVKLCPGPDGKEVFILCRSADRRAKEKAMHERFERRIEDGLKRLKAGSEKRPCTVAVLAQRVGRLLGQNTRAAGLFRAEVKADEKGHAALSWEKVEGWRSWAALSEGCYLLRSNVTDWAAEDLWRAYTQLTEAEGAFRVQKGDLCLRPVWHRKQKRVEARILVCFLAYALWKTLGQMCRAAGLGDEPRKVLEEINGIQAVDVVLPTREGVEIRKRCISRPTEHQAILLHKLGLRLPLSLAAVDV
jgi:transposase